MGTAVKPVSRIVGEWIDEITRQRGEPSSIRELRDYRRRVAS